MGSKSIKRLSPDVEEQAVEKFSIGHAVKEVAKSLGFKSVHAFSNYRSAFPDFEAEVAKARLIYCETLEDELLDMASVYGDSKMADVMSKNIMKVMSYRNPRVYGDRVDLNITQTIDIAGSLERAERRVQELSVTNVLKLTAKKDQE